MINLNGNHLSKYRQEALDAMLVPLNNLNKG